MIWFLVSVKKLESRQIWGKTVNFLTPLSSLEGIFVCVFICLVSLGYASRFGFISEIFHLCIYFPDLVPIIVSKNVFQTLFSCNPTETDILSGEMAQWETRLLNKPDDLSLKRTKVERENQLPKCVLWCVVCAHTCTPLHTHTIIIGVVMNNKQKF